MDFQLTDEQKMLKDMVHNFVEKEIRPKAAEWDEADQFVPPEIIQRYKELGLLGLTLPEEYGGQGLTAFEGILVIEEIARVSQSAAFPVFMSNLGPPKVIELFGTEEQKNRYLPRVSSGDTMISVAMTEAEAGSALTDLQTRAVAAGDYYIVNGQKRFCSGGGYSEAYLAYVRLGEVKGAKGIGVMIIDKGTPGFSFGKKEHFLGFRGIPCCDLIFEDCRVPGNNLVVKEGNFKDLMHAFDIARLGNAAMSLGIATGALEESVKYARERRQFGKPVGEFQAVQFMLADMAMKVEAARLLIYRAVVDAGRSYPSVLDSSMAKCFAGETAREVTDLALQIHGGYGYSKEYPIEKMLRDSRGWLVAGGTMQMQRVNITSRLLGTTFDQRR